MSGNAINTYENVAQPLLLRVPYSLITIAAALALHVCLIGADSSIRHGIFLALPEYIN
jgi:hypothetical protein